MRNLLSSLVLAIAALLALAVAAPAGARTVASRDADLSTRSVQVGAHACRWATGYRVAVDRAKVPDLKHWTANVTITGPHGYRDTALLWGPTDEGRWQQLWFCRRTNRAGTYTIKAALDITHTDGVRDDHSYETLRTTVAVRTRR